MACACPSAAQYPPVRPWKGRGSSSSDIHRMPTPEPWYGARMSGSVIADAFGHHGWANVRLIDACSALSAEQLATSVPGTYGSIVDTLRHIVGADAGYLNLLARGAVPAIRDEDERGMDLPALPPASVVHGKEWATLAGSEFDADQIAVRHRDDGTEIQAP